MNSYEIGRLQERASVGDIKAINALVDFYIEQKDLYHAKLEIERLKYINQPESYRKLGYIYSCGLIEKPDLDLARIYYKKGFELGDEACGYNLALLDIKEGSYIDAIPYLTYGVSVNHIPSIKLLAKLYIEGILKDLYKSDNEWDIVLLRYFNPVGAHVSGLIGEKPNGIPNNLVPYIAEVAAGVRPYLRVWGNDYDTPDGTGVRDYIHVVDLAYGHILSLNKIKENHGLFIYNLGTGKGYSVLAVVKAFEKASGITIPYQICDRRPGDIATCYADPTKAKEEIGFEAKRGIDEMMQDQWRFQKSLYIK